MPQSLRSSAVVVLVALFAQTFLMPLAKAGDIPSVPPPVIWDVTAQLNQFDWGGLSCPNCTWFNETFSSFGVEGGEWDISASWSGNHPSQAHSYGRMGASTLQATGTIASNWGPGNWIMEDAKAELRVRAWIRGGAGTEFFASVDHWGEWNGYVEHGGRAYLRGFNIEDVSCSNCNMGMTFAKSIEPSLIQVATGPTMYFDEFPDVPYTRATFVIDVDATPFVQDVSNVRNRSWVSCTLGCTPNRVAGGGSMSSRYRIWLNSNTEPPTVQVSAPSEPHVIGSPIDNVIAVTSSPDGVPIIDYQWYVDDMFVHFGSRASTLSWTPWTVGIHTVRVEVTDANGQWTAEQVEVETAPHPDYEGVILVPHMASTIQAAINMAVLGDEIVVTPGIYSEHLYIDKPVHLRSVGGPEVTTIDASSADLFDSHVIKAVGAGEIIIDGFTITGGSAEIVPPSTFRCGGGLMFLQTSGTVKNCVVTSNAAELGGGLWVREGHVVISDCVFSENTAFQGGGINVSIDAEAVVTHTKFVDNHANLTGPAAPSRGGGFAHHPDAIAASIYHSEFKGNTALDLGGAVSGALESFEIGNTNFCGSDPEHIDGPWIDLGGNEFADKCPPDCEPADLNCDGVVDVSDLLILLAAWGPCPRSGDCPADINGDGTVDVSDLLLLLAKWG